MLIDTTGNRQAPFTLVQFDDERWLDCNEGCPKELGPFRSDAEAHNAARAHRNTVHAGAKIEGEK